MLEKLEHVERSHPFHRLLWRLKAEQETCGIAEFLYDTGIGRR
jgi:hypothetical protein